MFVDPKMQARDDLKQLLSLLRRLWVQFDSKLREIEGHKDFASLLHGYNRKG